MPTKVVFDCSTGEAIVRELDAGELAQWRLDTAAAAEAAKRPQPKQPATTAELVAAITRSGSFDEAKANLDQLAADVAAAPDPTK